MLLTIVRSARIRGIRTKKDPQYERCGIVGCQRRGST